MVWCGVVWCGDRKSPRVWPVEQVEGNSAEVIDATDANLAGRTRESSYVPDSLLLTGFWLGTIENDLISMKELMKRFIV